jgi:hypothetical protein
MAEYFVVYNAGPNAGNEKLERKFKSAKTLAQPQQANFVNLEAGSVAEAQEAVENLFPASTSTPVCVLAAQWKES